MYRSSSSRLDEFFPCHSPGGRGIAQTATLDGIRRGETQQFWEHKCPTCGQLWQWEYQRGQPFDVVPLKGAFTQEEMTDRSKPVARDLVLMRRVHDQWREQQIEERRSDSDIA
jgi:hypothetical protein